LIERSLELNPSSADNWRKSGWLRLWAGETDLAIEHFETSLRLNPRVPMPSTLMGIGVGHFFARRFAEGRAMLLRSLQEQPSWVPSYRFLAACYAQMGRLDEAREVVKQLRALTPLVTPNADHWRRPEQRELFLSGLRLAMGEAT
jgi:pentatricopeptide repeat protein